MNISDIKNIESEAGVIATILQKPEYIFHCEQLKPSHFTDPQNAYIYYAVYELAKRGIEKIDAYNITNILNSKESTKKQTDVLTVPVLNELIDLSPVISRETVEEYKLLADNILDKAFRRETVHKLRECEKICFSNDENENIRNQIYQSIEGVICQYQNLDDVKPLSDQIDFIWSTIRKGQNSDKFIDFKFPTLNKYCRIARGDAIVFAAQFKRGKSLLLLNCLVDICEQGKKALYIDTEIPTDQFTMRLISHLSKVEYKKIENGSYSPSEEIMISHAIDWIKRHNSFTHIYIPMVTDDKIISLVKKQLHTYGLDVVILDYLKGNGDFSMDAYKNSAAMGKTTDVLKNYIAGDLNLAVLTAVQATKTGEIADSAKIIRNCSSLIYLERKTPEQIESDGGIEFGNMTLNVRANRNGEIMADEDYISLSFDGNRCMFKESKQPKKVEPY